MDGGHGNGRLGRKLNMRTQGTFYTMYGSADKAVVNSTTLADITGLTGQVKSGVIYSIDAFIPCNEDTNTKAFRFGINAPSSPTQLQLAVEVVDPSVGLAMSGTLTTVGGTVITALATPSALSWIKVKGVIQPSSDGTLAMQICNDSVDGSTITAKKGSYVTLAAIG